MSSRSVPHPRHPTATPISFDLASEPPVPSPHRNRSRAEGQPLPVFSPPEPQALAHAERFAEFRRRGGRPPRRPRIATHRAWLPGGHGLAWRPSSATAEDRNPRPSGGNRPGRRRGGRPPRRPRIATPSPCLLRPRTGRVAAVLRDGRGSQPGLPQEPRQPAGKVAAVLRDGRGSQLHRAARAHRRAGRWRPSSATAEDRNPTMALVGKGANGSGGRPPRRPRIATRSPAAGASRLPRGGRPPRRPRIATRVLRRLTCTSGLWRPSSATAEDRNPLEKLKVLLTHCGGRPPRRPRIATGPEREGHPMTALWRPSSATAEDRNTYASPVTVAAVLGGGRPPRRPRIATPP